MQWRIFSVWAILIVMPVCLVMFGTVIYVIIRDVVVQAVAGDQFVNSRVISISIWLGLGFLAIVFLGNLIINRVGLVVRNKFVSYSLLDIAIISISAISLSLAGFVLFSYVVELLFLTTFYPYESLMITFSTGILSFVIFSFAVIRMGVQRKNESSGS